jgi:very-short-patch-repair endonuclease
VFSGLRGVFSVVLFTLARLVVELDGWDTHGTRYAYEDEASDAEILARTSVPTMRITYRALHREPAAQAARITAILDRR